jgi:glycine cleavage system aminomethyltransferase T
MLREDGIVMDDGTTTRISENHYHMTTTTAQAANVLSHLEYYLQLSMARVKCKCSFNYRTMGRSCNSWT